MQREAPEATRAPEQALVQGQQSAPDAQRATETCGHAAVLHQRGLGDEAELMQRDVVTRLEAALGAAHHRTVAARAVLADMVYQRGGLHEAQGLQRGVLGACMHALGPDAPSTLSARASLANTLAKRGRLEEAEESLREVLRGRECALGPSHLDTVSVRASLAAALAMSGNFEEAQWLAREVCKGREAALHADSPDVCAAREFLAYVQQHLAEQQEELRAAAAEAGAPPPAGGPCRARTTSLHGPLHERTQTGWLPAQAQHGVATGRGLLQGPALLLQAPARLLGNGVRALRALPGGAWHAWGSAATPYASVVWNSFSKPTAAWPAATISALLGLDTQDTVRPMKCNAATHKNCYGST